MQKSIFVVVLLVAASRVFGIAGDVINPGTNDWFDAARTGVADMLIIGDSVVSSGGDGWQAGFAQALKSRVGIAGTGLVGGTGGTGEGYAAGPWGNPLWNFDRSSAPANVQGHLWLNSVATAGNTPVDFVGGWLNDKTIPSSSAIDWHIYHAPSAGGSMSAYSRLNGPPWTILQTLDPQNHVPQAQGLKESVFQFDAAPGVTAREFRLHQITNTSFMYSRMTVPNATGARVTHWGYGAMPST